MAANYTDEEVKHMVSEYTAQPNRETVDKLAEELNRSIKSIIGKLSREGVYQKAIYKTKTGEIPKTKAEIIVDIAEELGGTSSKLTGLEKAPKQELKYLYNLIRGEEIW